jgi:E3 ubiquitin-protein ligase HERC3
MRRGELYTWGLASSGELGHGGWTPIEVSVPKMITSLMRTRVVSVCAGANHTLAISEAGQLWSCGRGRHGQLGHGHFHDEGLLTLVEAIRCAGASARLFSAAGL